MRKAGTWLIFIYRVPSEPARKRTFVWRRLTQLGALYLQQAACLLPRNEANESSLRELAERVREFEGTATLLRAVSSDAQWEKSIIAAFNAERDSQYAKVSNETEKFLYEIQREEERKRYTLGELEELEEWLESLRRQIEKVKGRDFFKAAGATEARKAIQGAKERLEEFASHVAESEDERRGSAPGG